MTRTSAFRQQQAISVRSALSRGDYALSLDGRIVCAVERKSIQDLASSLISWRLRYAVAELAARPRAVVVVEDGYARVFALQHVRGAIVADGLAGLQLRYPNVPIVCGSVSPHAARLDSFSGSVTDAGGRTESV